MVIVFDGNFLLMKCVFTLNKSNNLYGNLEQLLNNSVEKYIKMNKWNNAIIVSDSRKKSWRHQFLKQYKGTRVKDDSIDWDYVFNTYNEWKDSLDYPVLIKDRVEGDDWITSLVLKYNKIGEGVVIMSSDKDLLQLLKYKLNKDKSYINVMMYDGGGKDKIYIPYGWKLWMEEYEEHNNNDVFNLNNSLHDINFINKLVNTYECDEINPYEQLFIKLVMGDKSDNIESIYQKLTNTGKIRNIGYAGAKKVWDYYHEHISDNFIINEKFQQDLIDCFKIVNKLSDIDDNLILEKLKLNIKLIHLHYKYYPDEILELIIEGIETI